MRLIEDWKRVLARSISVRFQILGAVCTGFLYGYSDPINWKGLAICVFFASAGIFSRIIWQKDFHAEDED